MERNYNIYDQEFLTIIHGLKNWRHLLVGSPHLVIVLMDHNNLQYWRHPQWINRRIACYLLCLADYDVQLKHQPGVTNKADHLSHRPDYDQGTKDNLDITALPNHLFANIINLATLQEDIRQSQRDHETTLHAWEQKHHLTKMPEGWYKDHRLVVMEDNILRKGVTHLIHASDTTGHPGITKTLTLLNRNYWWPGMKEFATQYIRGCALCQSRKNITTHPKPPQFPITMNPEVQPFECIALDFITKLPPLSRSLFSFSCTKQPAPGRSSL